MNIRSHFQFNKWITLQIFVFICICFAFSLLVIKNFSFPLTGWTGIGPWDIMNYDYVDIQEYTGFYLAKNLSFNPFPQLDLFNNQIFYPYGANSVFQPWLIEGDIFYAILYSFFWYRSLVTDLLSLDCIDYSSRDVCSAASGL